MRTFLFTCIHIPSGQRFARMERFDSLNEFYARICAWNNEQPTTWAYAPTGEAS